MVMVFCNAVFFIIFSLFVTFFGRERLRLYSNLEHRLAFNHGRLRALGVDHLRRSLRRVREEAGMLRELPVLGHKIANATALQLQLLLQRL